MNKIALLLFWLCGPQAIAGITYQKNKAQDKPTIVEETASSIDKATNTGDINKVTARLRIEGASFRPFNLCLADSEVEGSATQLQRKTAQDIHQIIERDLKIVHGFNFVTHQGPKSSGDLFALMKQKGAEGVTTIRLKFRNDLIDATIDHKNLISGKRSIKSFGASVSGQRRLSHLLAQSIYEEYIGPESIFLLQIAAVRRDPSGSQIVLFDFDGFNETVITQGPWQKTSPIFSPEGKSIIYTVITSQGHGIVEQDIGSKHMQFRTRKPGLNLDARVIPDNSGMLMTLSFEGNPNIYRATRTGTILGKVSQGLGMNLSPSVSPDGKQMAFVSTRAGTPQIYVQLLGGNSPATRLTHQGKYNQTPQFSPDGRYVAFTGRDERNVFDIFLLELTSHRVSRITENQGRNQEPFFTPSGRFVYFTSEREGKSKPDLFIATLNGDHQFRLTDASARSTTLGYISPVVRPKAF